MRTLALETVSKIGQEVKLAGWVNTRRDHGKIVFLDLRDRTGIVQLVAGADIADARPEDVVEVIGTVKERPASMVNEKIPTGKIEVSVKELKIISKARELPFPIDTDGYAIEEEVRMKYRYLDLRRPRLQRNLKFRSEFIREIREFFYKHGFIEIETPYLSSPTPEGARDFLIPSRLQRGKFYALPQSPQQYKQLLMVARLERYFQIARCFRDEDPRADRAYGEFTQLDLEMSFVDREDVMKITEEMIIEIYEKLGIKIKQKPFPVFTYQEAMKKFGKDKFDLRTEEEKKESFQAFAWVVDFPFFEKTEDRGWTFTHNPFSAPLPEYKEDLLNKRNIDKILTTQYDLVCNGYEVGGGSIRAHESAVLEKVFEIMGYGKNVLWQQFGHMLEAFNSGAPPHGGIAPGIDRLLTCILGEPSLRETIAFPMTSGGKTAVMDAPSEATPDRLKELGIAIVRKEKTKDIYSTIVEFLENNKIHFKTFEHAPVFTSQEAADIRGTSLHQGAKALVMVGDKKPLMIVLPADLKVNMKDLKIKLKIKDLRMATPKEVAQFTGTQVGAVPPLGNLFNIPLYVDEKLRDNETIDFNAGLHTKSIEMKEKDFEKITKPIVGKFSTSS